jgi:hypothetical protein
VKTVRLDLVRAASLAVALSASAACSRPQAPTASTPVSSAPPALDSERAFARIPEDSEWRLWLQQVRAVVAKGADARRGCAQLAGAEQLKCTCAQACRLQFPPLPHGSPQSSVEWPPLIVLQVNAAGTVDACSDHQTTIECPAVPQGP